MEIKTCPKCNGTRKIVRISRIKDPDNDIDMVLRGEIDCPKCAGSGVCGGNVVSKYTDSIISSKYVDPPIIQIA